MAKRETIKVGSFIHYEIPDGKSNLNLLLEVSESQNKHYKIIWCKIPSTKGKRPIITKEFYWTTISHFKEFIKKKSCKIITKTLANKYIKEGL